MQLSTFGGVSGIVLLLISILSVGIISERSLFWFSTLRKDRRLSSNLIDNFLDSELLINVIQPRDYHHILYLMAKRLDQASLCSIDKLQDNLDQAFSEIEDKLQKYDGVLATIISISPLMGLLGTVLGLMRSMHGLTLNSLADSNLSVMAGISEALISTAAGLTIAVFTLVATNTFRGLRVSELRRIRSLARAIERKYIDTPMAS